MLLSSQFRLALSFYVLRVDIELALRILAHELVLPIMTRPRMHPLVCPRRVNRRRRHSCTFHCACCSAAVGVSVMHISSVDLATKPALRCAALPTEMCQWIAESNPARPDDEKLRSLAASQSAPHAAGRQARHPGRRRRRRRCGRHQVPSALRRLRRMCVWHVCANGTGLGQYDLYFPSMS